MTWRDWVELAAAVVAAALSWLHGHAAGSTVARALDPKSRP